MNQNNSSFDHQEAAVINFRKDVCINIDSVEGMVGASPIERLFRQSGRTTRMMNTILEYKRTAAMMASRIYPKGLPEIVKTVVVFVNDAAAAKTHQDHLHSRGKNNYNIHCVSIDSKEFKELCDYAAITHSFDEKRPASKMLNVLVDNIFEINAALRNGCNAEIVLDHEIYEKAYAGVINRFMDFAITTYRHNY